MLNSFIIENFLEHVIVLNKLKRVEFCTKNIEQLLGYSSSELQEKGIEFLFQYSKLSLNDVIDKSVLYNEFLDIQTFAHKTKKYINISYRVYNYNEDGATYYIIYLKDNTIQNIERKDIIKKTLTIESLSKSRKIRDGFLNEAVYEIIESSSRAMNTTRVNAWLFDKEKSEIQCIGNFDARVNSLVSQSSLPRIAMPNYFNLFETKKIIIINDAFNDPKVSELFDFYLKPHNICALIDVPIRIEGEMIGVICFENVGKTREWTLQEQKYGLVAAQMLSLTIETHNKQLAKKELEITLNEKKVLLQEIHHRVKNNLSIVSGLLNLQANKSKDEYHKQLFIDSKNRLTSISSVHELIYKAESYSKLNFKDYIEQIIKHLSVSFQSANTDITIVKGITDVHIDISYAIPLALIVNELITNAYKHAFTGLTSGKIEITLLENNNTVFLNIKDNGVGIKEISTNEEEAIGISIVHGLFEQINAVYKIITSDKGTEYKISFSKK